MEHPLSSAGATAREIGQRCCPALCGDLLECLRRTSESVGTLAGSSRIIRASDTRDGERCSAIWPRRSFVARTGRAIEQGRRCRAGRFAERHNQLAEQSASAATQRGTESQDFRSHHRRQLFSHGRSRQNTDALRTSTHPSESNTTSNHARLLLRKCVRCLWPGGSAQPTLSLLGGGPPGCGLMAKLRTDFGKFALQVVVDSA